ncbi:PEP/pyruvate-binding domain-containing protein [Paracoccus xiamenensis]|uniref:PEP/pyruvate-binding domain-containing protein n=1 Tax=Paracoccus xiamenensis TaxID=2714901 RepID=UPI00140CBF4A|nr:PEP/pyruvate-binding domain-containing protein [Paracoccus xiamenensis]NHF73177.1 phosphoenolpyruvate synthase [Paracoccus xiamenensis]
MSFIIPQNAASDAALVGGKAASLHRLAAAGFAPPDFFVIRPAAFSKGAPDPALAQALAPALAALGPGPYAVRSSARAEDGAEYSHAGQFDTCLNVAAPEVIAAAAQVWASGFADSVQTYRDRHAGGAAEAPAIIVQRMIDAQAAGVAFSANPVSGLRGEVVISAVAGLGEKLVAGEVDGESWVIGATPTAPDVPTVLTPKQAAAIADLARRAEATFGAPQDIEWAIDADGLHILQSRPITTPLRPLPAPDDHLTIFDNSNIVESYPGMVSPLTYSFAMHVYDRVYRAFVDLLGVPAATVAGHADIFANMLGRVDGRVYYNLGNWYRALALLPGFALNRGYMETMMGLSEPLPQALTASIGPPPAKGLARALEYLRVARVGAGLIWQALRLPRTRARFYTRLNAALGSDLDLETAGPTALAAQYRRIEGDLLDRWDAPLVNDFLCMIGFGASRKLLEKWLGPQGLVLHNDVMIGQGDIISAEPARRIAEMGAMVRDAGLTEALAAEGAQALDGHPRIAAELEAYLQKFGDRCTEELKLESIPLMQEPASLLAAIAASAAQVPRARHAAADPDWPALFPNNPLRRRVARGLTNWTKARVRDRENLRFERTRIFGYARRVFLALGREFHARGLLDDPRDIFWLTTPEVLGAIEGFGLSSDLRAIAAMRKAEDAASARRPDPPERIEMRGPAIAPVWSGTASPTSEARVQTGTGCSAGQATAKARIIRDPRRETLAPGDILVARHTDPGWIAVFSNASAIVVERGSLLSHSAIVARELGIPCVVGLKGATDWITDGEHITVDGATGKVERVDA